MEIGLTVEQTKNGQGILTTKKFLSGEIIFQVRGILLTIAEAALLDQESQNNTFRFSAEHYLSPKGEIGNFLNHACDPNSYVKKKGEELFVVALKDIMQGEEVTIDYSTILAKDDAWEMDCHCGGEHCRKKISRFISLDERTKTKYLQLGAVPEYIR